MKAVAFFEYGPPDVLQLVEVDKPVPRDDEVLIRISDTVVTTLDCDTRRGALPFSSLNKPSTTILGFEISGVIEAVGKNVTRFRIGDHVYGATTTSLGGHAEYICLPEDGPIAVKPTRMSHKEAAAIVEGGLTALPFLRDTAKIQRDQEILIIGASGSIGTAAVQFAKYYGAIVTGVCSTQSIELVRTLGADEVIDYTKEDFTMKGKTYDVIFDILGKSTFSRCRKMLKGGGIYLTAAPSLKIIVQMVWTTLIGRKKAAIAFTGLRSADEKVRDLEFINELFTAGKITAVIDRTFPLEQLPDAHRYVESGNKKGNVVITIGDGEPRLSNATLIAPEGMDVQ